MAFVHYSCPLTRLLVILCMIRGVMAFEGLKCPGGAKFTREGNLKLTCNSPHYINTIHTMKCERDITLLETSNCTGKRMVVIGPGLANRTLCTRKQYDDSQGHCQDGKPVGEVNCKDENSKRIYSCSFNATEKYTVVTWNIYCLEFCRAETHGNKSCLWLMSNVCPITISREKPPTTTAPPTTEAPTTEAPTTAAPEEEFPIWAAILIALGIGGLIALCLCLWLCLPCRKREQAQRGNAENPEGGEDAEGEEPESAESSESSEKSKESAAEGGEEATEEE
ncbi:uncharacterized protein LOC112572451 isoform X2 [Pomacea canaliculata]|uniref:uncharacterized protein LOC112572451 isoform X2 n=1 Tax=Pomacea canaliculata TaxID=400727 RepID=UPI000D72D725|nr:uncharacterized protein LOC112572451 isoform X2 [Pomacea canaliculata]